MPHFPGYVGVMSVAYSDATSEKGTITYGQSVVSLPSFAIVCKSQILA